MSILKEALNALKFPNLEVGSALRRPVVITVFKTKLVPDFAARLADALSLPFIPCIEKAFANRQQKEMENSYQQVRNLDGVFNITDQCQDGECLLIDDMIDSGWTFTVASALLSQAGCSAIYPMALALNSPRMD
jgi:ATP-dependent DNA helicase RecQ